MDSFYRYRCSPASIKNFDTLRTVTLWAGSLGVLQSIIWIGLNMTAILAYNCMIPLQNNNFSFSSAVPNILFKKYFKGDCIPDGYKDIATTLETTLNPKDIFIWMCVYLGIAVCWLLISVLLLTHVEKHAVNTAIYVLYIWVACTISIILMDLGLGIIFGIDYGRFYNKGFDYPIVPTLEGLEFLVGAVAAISMMIISFKGFVLWIINVILVGFVLMEAIKIKRDDYENNVDMRHRLSDDVMTTNPPIRAFENKVQSNAYDNQGFVAYEQPPFGKIELNKDSIARAARISADSTLQDRRFRNFNAFSQYPTPRTNTTNLTQSNSSNNNVADIGRPESTAFAFPVPDYSPPMARTTNSLQF